MKTTVKAIVKQGEYHDSVSLMLVARELNYQDGVQDSAVVMATEANKSILFNSGLLTDEIKNATSNDLVLVVSAIDEYRAKLALDKAEQLLKAKPVQEEHGEKRPKTVRSALSLNPDVNMAVISVAGRYAANEAWEALRHGLHVLLFSDNVSLEDEIALKKYAHERGLFLMGPGAGTAIINGVALGFANVPPRGPVGIVSAAGTGLQEVSTLIARHGVGISQGIGTGGRDLKKEVGGMMMLQGLQFLQQDPETTVIVLISKPPAEEVAQSILAQASCTEKPVVACFLGGNFETIPRTSNVTLARTLQECSLLASDAVQPEQGKGHLFLETEQQCLKAIAEEPKKALKTSQRYLRGLFSGGTLCYEAQVVWKDMQISPVHSNAPLPGNQPLPDSSKSIGHTAVDLGEEEFTVGRPHPMIDNDLRIRRLLQEARDPETAVIMLDVVLGYGAHPDPASELGPAIIQACDLAKASGRELNVVASVTGTEGDPQGLAQTIDCLEEAEVIICSSNASAARLAGMIVSI
jgi:succinyl-CoA synthetase alpha subunit